MGSRPLVTVVIPFLNAERFLRESVESVLAQRYERWELMLVDDGSTDGSSRIAREYERRLPDRVRYLEHPGHENRGLSASRNLGVTSGSGELVACLDSDDVWFPEKLEEQVALLARHPDVGFLFGRMKNWFSWTGDPEDEARDELMEPGIEMDTPLAAKRLIAAMIPRTAITPSQSCMILRREVVEAVGGYEDSFRGMYEDQAFVAKINLIAPCYLANRLWHLYRQHPDSIYTIAKASGDRSQWRIQYLEWLIGYLRKQGPAAESLLRLAEAELRPLVKTPTRRFVERFAATGRRVAKAAIPASLRPRVAEAMRRMKQSGQRAPEGGSR